MNYLEKIKKIRDDILSSQKEQGKEFSYALMGFGIGEDPIDDWTFTITPDEQLEIVKYLKRRDFLKIIEETRTSLKIKVSLKKDPIIKLKTLELISRELKDYYTGYEITKLLEECGADKKLIIYPNSKWYVFYGLFEELAIAQDEKANKLLFKIISESIHPLNLGGDKLKSETLVKKFNEYLKYDNLVITYSDHDQKYSISDIKNLIELDDETVLQDFSLIEEILPDINKSTFSEKVIELISKEFTNYLSTNEIKTIIKPLLKNNKILYEEPAIKGYVDDLFEEKVWLFSFENVLQTIRKKDEEADKKIQEIIETLLHPLNYNADENKTEEIAKKLQKYLRYGNFYIQNTGKEYIVSSEKEMNEMHSSSPEFEEQEKQDKKDDEDKIKQNKEAIRKIRDSHQSYIDILEIFCRDTKKPTKELNDAYIFLSNKIEKNIKELEIKNYTYQLFFYKPFKNNLYSAENEWNNFSVAEKVKRGAILSWDSIRPLLYKVHSDIIRLLNIAEEDTEMTNEEKKLENITKLISEKRTQKPIPKEVTQTMKIEISKMPDLNIKNVEDNSIVKNNKKRITLPKFPRTEWAKVLITFLDETNILLSDGKSTKPSSFEGIGCDDGRNGKADESWNFLLKLAKGNGQTLPITKRERESEKKQKQKITDILRRIFDNQTEPFEKEVGGVYKARFNIKYNTENKEIDHKDKYADSNDVFIEMTEFAEENIKDDFSQ